MLVVFSDHKMNLPEAEFLETAGVEISQSVPPDLGTPGQVNLDCVATALTMRSKQLP